MHTLCLRNKDSVFSAEVFRWIFMCRPKRQSGSGSCIMGRTSWCSLIRGTWRARGSWKRQVTQPLTTSAGVAASLGYPDAQRISRGEMLEVVARIARAVRVPVTADMEAGYGTTVEEMIETAKAVVAAGAVGMNLGDVTGGGEGSEMA